MYNFFAFINTDAFYAKEEKKSYLLYTLCKLDIADETIHYYSRNHIYFTNCFNSYEEYSTWLIIWMINYHLARLYILWLVGHWQKVLKDINFLIHYKFKKIYNSRVCDSIFISYWYNKTFMSWTYIFLFLIRRIDLVVI